MAKTTNQKLLDALILMYDKYENGDSGVDEVDEYMGMVIHLTEAEEKQVLTALESAGIKTALRKGTA